MGLTFDLPQLFTDGWSACRDKERQRTVPLKIAHSCSAG
jgi:hypothetical protein